MSMTATRMAILLAFLFVLLQVAVVAADAAVVLQQEIKKEDSSAFVQVAPSPKLSSPSDSYYYTKLQAELTANYNLWMNHTKNVISGGSYEYIYQQYCHCPEAYTRPLQISVKVIPVNSTTTTSTIQGQTHTKEIVTLAMYKEIKKETSMTKATKDGNDDGSSSSSTTSPTDDGSGLRKRRRTAAVAVMPVTIEDAILTPSEENENISTSSSSVYPPSSMHIPTIQNLFDMVQQSIDAHAEVIRVQYDVDYGYPTSVDLDYSSMIVDEETRFTATQLSMLVSQEEEPPELPKTPLVEKEHNCDNDNVIMMATSVVAPSSSSSSATTTTTTSSSLPEEEQDSTLSEFYMNGKINLYDLAITLNSLLEESPQEGDGSDRAPPPTNTDPITPLALKEALRSAADDYDSSTTTITTTTATASLLEQLVRRNIQDTRFVQELHTTHFYQHYPTFDTDGSHKVDMYELTLGLIQRGISTSRSNIKRLHKIMKDTPLVK